MKEPLISVVTPSYNQAEYISDTLSSIKNQSYNNIEHIVVDGQSHDGTHDILRKHEKDYNLKWQSAPDNGQSDAINTGFDRVSGDIIGWLNSDDVYFDTDVFKRVAKYFNNNDADVIYGDIGYIDAESTVGGMDVRPDFDPRLLRYRSTIAQPAAFFSKTVVSEERLDPEFHFTMDWEFWIRLSECRSFDFHHVPDVLAGFRRHETQKTEDQESMEREFQLLRKKHNLPPGAEARNLLTEIAPAEARRHLSAVNRTWKLHKYPPELAFDGQLATLPSMLLSLGPSYHDIRKTFRRWRDN
jgi:glycosyltransferase involved in cell wall biosynthesis